MSTHLRRLMAKALKGELPPLPENDGERAPGEKTVAHRKAREAFYGQVYDPGKFRPRS